MAAKQKPISGMTKKALGFITRNAKVDRMLLKFNGILGLKWRKSTRLDHDPRGNYGSNPINFGESRL
jgi:hypothetical protein